MITLEQYKLAEVMKERVFLKEDVSKIFSSAEETFDLICRRFEQELTLNFNQHFIRPLHNNLLDLLNPNSEGLEATDELLEYVRIGVNFLLEKSGLFVKELHVVNMSYEFVVLNVTIGIPE
jgi:hypothetical protein